MSDTVRNLKVSRQGVILIKSFAGFRPRAQRRGDGWVIGYGHTASAREGATLSEAEAELLLQYDLIPVVAAINDADLALNSHQFDALASFALSLGVERFVGSDVLARLRDGDADRAADALSAWPEPEDATPRRRAAERALFLADPAQPVPLVALVSARLPDPVPAPDEVAVEAGGPDRDAVSASGAPTPSPMTGADPSPDADAFVADSAPVVAAPDAPPGDVVQSTEPTPAAGDDTVSSSSEPAPFPTSADARSADAAPASVDGVRSVMRERTPVVVEPSTRGETAAFLVMGAVGMVALGAAVAAFRLAVDQRAGGTETTVIAGVLAVVGVACVGVAAVNLYRRWGRA